MTLRDWDAAQSGADCPLCPPQEGLDAAWHRIASLRIGSLYLNRNQAFRGHSMLVFDARHETRLERLAPDEYSTLMGDLRVAAGAIVEVVSPDHVNYASLGNEVPHLHWHVIPRYKSDPRWRKAIWAGAAEEAPVERISEDECEALATKIRNELR